ncbi:hypothetical protein A3770_08p51050 [Chloropicon primus]|uniref:SnoaL-like domain-containing protein n=2 Tax=Chloropicon primus TaxID=1764295 RepID=A0A5B8MQA9_9CHLO|nr:hypothetical protein A3770_08p51050 [Chloropicon primus]|eukprot:QDZ22587.1 hypothetical protein A3770_08p51050 [Chloropicon primus]
MTPRVKSSQSLPEPPRKSEASVSSQEGRPSSSSGLSVGSFKLSPAASVARRFFDAINGRDFGKHPGARRAAGMLAEAGVLVEDLNEPVAFAGKEEAEDFLLKRYGAVDEGVTLVIDELTDGRRAVGVTWHLESDGKVVPNGRGCTFLRIDDKGDIVYLRDAIEPASKPGEVAFGIMKVVLPLLRYVDTSRATQWPENLSVQDEARDGEAARVVRAFYSAINRKEVETAMEYFADDCLYEDLNFPEPYRGKAKVKDLMQESCDSIPGDLVFCIDDISDGDRGVGVTWHLELDGKPFPFSRGCSLYKVVDSRIVYARDLVEPSSGKKGKGLPPRQEKRSNVASLGFALAAAVYTSALILSPPDSLPFVPGEGLFWIKPETLEEIKGSSFNFFYVAPALQSLGIDLPLVPQPLPAYHPVNEALFNLVNAWSLMFLPLLLRDTKSEGMNKTGWWSVQMFLTNAVLMPFLALRAVNSEPTVAQVKASRDKSGNHKLLSKSFGVIGAVVGAASLWWFAFARPELGGDLASRVEYFERYATTDRVAFAFCVDLCLYSIWQPFLISAVERDEGLTPDASKFVPFFGLCKWLQTSSGLKLFDKR